MHNALRALNALLNAASVHWKGGVIIFSARVARYLLWRWAIVAFVTQLSRDKRAPLQLIPSHFSETEASENVSAQFSALDGAKRRVKTLSWSHTRSLRDLPLDTRLCQLSLAGRNRADRPVGVCVGTMDAEAAWQKTALIKLVIRFLCSSVNEPRLPDFVIFCLEVFLIGRPPVND